MIEKKMRNIILRPLKISDSDFMLELVNNPEVTKYLPALIHNKQMMLSWIKSLDDSSHEYIIQLEKSSTDIGECSLIPIPEEFKEYILKHHKERKKRHLLSKCTDHVKIKNEPRFDHRFEAQIFRNGNVIYKNNLIYPGFMCISIPRDDAAFIINPIMEQLFCYDEENHGSPMIDAYHWEIEFYTKKGLSHKTEGWPGENAWRKQEFAMILKFAERYIAQSLGSEFLE